MVRLDESLPNPRANELEPRNAERIDTHASLLLEHPQQSVRRGDCAIDLPQLVRHANSFADPFRSEDDVQNRLATFTAELAAQLRETDPCLQRVVPCLCKRVSIRLRSPGTRYFLAAF